MAALDIPRPRDTRDICELVADAAQGGRVLQIRAGGSKRDIGAPGRTTCLVDLAEFGGIVDYQPSELVLTVRPSTPLAEVEALLGSHGQMLAFEPWDHGPLFGRAAGAATIGGVVSAAVAGSRRVSAGGVRDHLLGFTAVSGRGEIFKAGGKVVKNVTGYDVPKLMAGAWGQLAIMTELTLKVAPRPRSAATVAVRSLAAAAAIAAMTRAMRSRCSVVAAAHLPGSGAEAPLTLLRLEGFPESVELRASQLCGALSDFGETALLGEGEAADVWTSIREVRPFALETLWRVQVAPSQAEALADALQRFEAEWFYDWAGALVWVGAPATADIRAAAAARGGHAMLLRAPLNLRKTVRTRHPEPPAIALLSARLKQAFDPAGVLDPHRFG